MNAHHMASNNPTRALNTFRSTSSSLVGHGAIRHSVQRRAIFVFRRIDILMWITEEMMGSVSCPVCRMHVSIARILWWDRLTNRQKQAHCPRYREGTCYGDQLACPEMPPDGNTRRIVLWEGHDSPVKYVSQKPLQWKDSGF
jgi:hypothetical protein